jgi:hypothetical protein
MQHGVGLRLKMELAELRQRHRLPPPVPHIEESLPETEDAPCTLSGYASTYDVDLERMKFRKYSLLWSPYKLPPLYYRHQPLVIGTVVELQDTDAGVGVSVITDHPPAMCCAAFSIAATIHAYHLEQADTLQFYAVVERATLDEISLVDRPANPRALVYDRVPARSPCHETNELLLKGFRTLQQLVELHVKGVRT